MSAQDILAELLRLPAEDRDFIAKTLQTLKEEEQSKPSSIPKEPRVPNLHPGAMVMSPDFDDPLPDEFWLGKDA